MSNVARKKCSVEGCDGLAVIRVQPFKKPTWDFFCSNCWIQLAINTVREAHDAGYLVVEKDRAGHVLNEPPSADTTETHLTLVDSASHTLV